MLSYIILSYLILHAHPVTHYTVDLPHCVGGILKEIKNERGDILHFIVFHIFQMTFV